MEDLSIGEVARRSGVPATALRYYEHVGILPAPRRVNGRRRYDAVVLRMLEVLRFAQGAGFTLEEVRTLFHGFGADIPLPDRWAQLAARKAAELDALIARAQRMRAAIDRGLGCGCVRLEDCVLDLPCEGGAGATSA